MEDICKLCIKPISEAEIKLFVKRERVCKACYNAYFESGE